MIRYPRTIIRTDLVDAHLYLIKKSCLDVAICSKYSSFRKEFLPKMIRQMATGQSLEVLISTTANKKMMIRQTSLLSFSFVFSYLNFIEFKKIATDLDDHIDFSRLLEQYDCDNKQIRGGCYYSIDETQVFRVKNVLSYLEANRQVTYEYYFSLSL